MKPWLASSRASPYWPDGMDPEISVEGAAVNRTTEQLSELWIEGETRGAARVEHRILRFQCVGWAGWFGCIMIIMFTRVQGCHLITLLIYVMRKCWRIG